MTPIDKNFLDELHKYASYVEHSRDADMEKVAFKKRLAKMVGGALLDSMAWPVAMASGAARMATRGTAKLLGVADNPTLTRLNRRWQQLNARGLSGEGLWRSAGIKKFWPRMIAGTAGAMALPAIPQTGINLWEDYVVQPGMDELVDLTSQQDSGWKWKAMLNPDEAYEELRQKLQEKAGWRGKKYVDKYIDQLKSEGGRGLGFVSMVSPEWTKNTLKDQATRAVRRETDKARNSFWASLDPISFLMPGGYERYDEKEKAPMESFSFEKHVKPMLPALGTAAAGLAGAVAISKFVKDDDDDDHSGGGRERYVSRPLYSYVPVSNYKPV